MSGAAPTILLRFPSMLGPIVGGDRLEVRGASIPDVLEAAFERVPTLRDHLTLGSGELRPHILCIVNGESVLRDEVAVTRLSDGDEVWIHQAISGG